MKTQYISIALAAVCALAIGCAKEKPLVLDELQVSSSYVAINADGGEASIVIDAVTDWTFDFDVDVPKDSLDIEKGIVKYKEAQKQMSLSDNQWVTIAPMNGGKGKTTVTFKADATESARKIAIRVKAGDKFQNIIVSQYKKVEAALTPIADVVKMTSADDGKVLRIEGSCTAIASTSYGNFYMQDAAGNEVYIYGTVDESGSYNWSKFGIELGDKVTVEGPYSNYKGTHELVDASFIKVEKALLSSKDVTKTICKGAEPFTITLTQKGVGLESESQAEWLTLGNGYTTDKNGNYVFTVTPTENATGKIRKGTLKFVSTKIEKNDTISSILMVTVNQLAAAAPVKGSLKTIRDIVKGSTDSKNPIEFCVEVENATVTYVNGDNAFVEDAECGLLFYKSGLKVGQVINGCIYGSGYLYSNLPEVATLGTDLAKITELTKKPQPQEVALDSLYTNFDKYVSRYVIVKDGKAGDDIDINYSQAVKAGSLTNDKGSEIVLYIQSTSKYNGKSIYFYFQAPKDTDLEVTSIPTVYKTTNQLKIFDGKWLKVK